MREVAMKWYKRDPDAALTGMRGLSHDAKAAYGTIIDLSYSRDGNLPDDEHLLCIHIECRPQWWRRVKAELIAAEKIRVFDGKLVANRVETTLKEAQNYTETQSKRATKGWVSRKKHNIHNGSVLPLGNAYTTTTTYKKENFVNFKDKGNDYRAPPQTKSDNVLESTHLVATKRSTREE
jgi:uncharacterized protein YdaU (DUF1376 family)